MKRNTNDRSIPEAFPPGEDVREELEARGWTQLDLAAIIDRPASVVNDIISGRRSITAETAALLGRAFNTSAQFWLNLQAAYNLAMTDAKSDDAVERRRRLYEKAPMRDILRRGWIENSSNIDILEQQLCQILEIDNIDSEVKIRHAARKSTTYDTTSSAQIVWLMRAKHLAKTLTVENRFSLRTMNRLLRELALLREYAEDIHNIPRLLSRYGIRFLVVEHLPKSKIDGACFWLNKQSPVIVLSMRYDRIDYFWFSLAHELGHVRNKDGILNPIIDTDLVGDEEVPAHVKPMMEKKADMFAIDYLMDQEALTDFINRHDPIYSKRDIIGFARTVCVHPGIVVGQMHPRGRNVIPFTHFRAMLEKIRSIITESALTDGWGYTIS